MKTKSFATTTDVKAGQMAFLTPSGKVSPHKGKATYVGEMTTGYAPVGVFQQNAKKGDLVTVAMAKTFNWEEALTPDGELQASPHVDMQSLPIGSTYAGSPGASSVWTKTDTNKWAKGNAKVSDADVQHAYDHAMNAVITKPDDVPVSEIPEVNVLQKELNKTKALLSLAIKDLELSKSAAQKWQKLYYDKKTFPQQGYLPPEGQEQGVTDLAKEVAPLGLPLVFRKGEKLDASIHESMSKPNPVPCEPSEANLVTSELAGSYGLHAMVLDLDFPCKLVPSSQKGRYHLYVSKPVTWQSYAKVLEALRDAGILQEGFVTASIHRGFTSVRPPWIKKTQEEIDAGSGSE